MTVDEIKAKYEKRILALMGRLRDAIVQTGFMTTEVQEITCDEYKWSFEIHVDNDPSKFGPQDVGIDFTIMESGQHDGTDEGVNFELKVQGYGGRVLGSICPFNFTPEVWVKSEADVEERFKLLEMVDDLELVDCIDRRLLT
jgi:hypothetical protein